MRGIPLFIGGFFGVNSNENLNDISDMWNSVIEGVVYADLNDMCILPLIKFKTFTPSDQINFLLIKNMGEHKENIINFQYDLIENGFERHAKWRP